MTIPLGRPSPDASRDLPENLMRKGTWAGCPAPFSYLVLLPVGFAMPMPLPASRCALTAPFHPCRRRKRPRRSVLCGTVPKIALAGRYPAPSFRGARTFLHRHGKPQRPRSSGRLARAV